MGQRKRKPRPRRRPLLRRSPPRRSNKHLVTRFFCIWGFGVWSLENKKVLSGLDAIIYTHTRTHTHSLGLAPPRKEARARARRGNRLGAIAAAKQQQQSRGGQVALMGQPLRP